MRDVPGFAGTGQMNVEAVRERISETKICHFSKQGEIRTILPVTVTALVVTLFSFDQHILDTLA